MTQARRLSLAGWPYERIAAHRGAGVLAPENTFSAMRLAHQLGVRAVEFDVMLAADGVPVLMHDPQLGRTVPGVGDIDSIPSAVLANMDAGSWFDVRYRGEGVPLFAELAQWLQGHGIWMNIEIKPFPGRERDTGQVVGQLTQALFQHVLDPAKRPLFSSFSPIALSAAREAAPGIARGLLVGEVPADWLAQLQALDCVSLHCRHDKLNAGLAAQIKAEGYGLLCYTVNEPVRARELFSWGVDCICTDRIDLIGADFR